ncbi:DUF2510 domain-containing protein [Agromyces atrinae]|uniref:DUF2510 domain-containing protein n=1 Tax=Agromyces atrinae TaxID=592376 RepID=UPI001F58F81B|nr:DUF2510 domain-containing protein [Agromyces atrinae]MCI2956270.1 DUF2510 domain-containing protein [Agromyces atrinae]
MSGIAAGWYDDGHGAVRYWNGDAWTEHVAPEQPLAPEVAPDETSVAPTETTVAAETSTTPAESGWAPISEPVVPAPAPAPAPALATPVYPAPDAATRLTPPAPRRRRVWPWVVGGVAAVLVIGGGMVGAVVVAMTVVERGTVVADGLGLPSDAPISGATADPAPSATGEPVTSPGDPVQPSSRIGYTSEVELTGDALLVADAYDRFNSALYGAECDALFDASSDAFRGGWIETCDDLLEQTGGAISDPGFTATIIAVGTGPWPEITVEEDYEGFGTVVAVYGAAADYDGIWRLDSYFEKSSPESPAE